MRIDSLATLVRIADVGSFSEAARLQHLSLSGLSSQMKALERDLGVELFDRGHRPPALTPLGARVAELARSVTERAVEIRRLCWATDDELTGRYRLGIVPTMAVRRLPLMMRNAARLAPDAQFELTIALTDALTDAVERGALDVAVVTKGPGLPPHLASTVIASERLVTVVPTANARAGLDGLAATTPFIHFRAGIGIGRLIAKALVDAGPPPATSFEVDAIETAVELVNQGLGYTMVPEPDARRYASRDATTVTRDGDPYRELVLISNRATIQPAQHARHVHLWTTPDIRGSG